MGNVKGKTNCRYCIDCQRMMSPLGVSWRCYGENKSMTAPLKKDFATGEEKPPRISPNWCPHRKSNQ